MAKEKQRRVQDRENNLINLQVAGQNGSTVQFIHHLINESLL